MLRPPHLRLQLQAHRDQARPLADVAEHAGRAVLAESADLLAGGGELERFLQRREQAVHLGRGHDEVGRAEIQERVTAGHHLVLVAVGDGADRRELDVPADQLHPDAAAGDDLRLGRSGRGLRFPHGATLHRNETGAAQHRRQAIHRPLRHAGEQQGCGDRSHLRRTPGRGGDGVEVGREVGGQSARIPEKGERVAGDGGRAAARPGQVRGGGLLLLDLQHLLDRRHPRHRLARKTPGIGHGARQPVTEEDRAAAHAAQHAGVRERSARQPHQDEVAPRTDVLEGADHFDLEVLHPGAAEHGLPDPLHAGLDLAEREDLLGDCRARGEEWQDEPEETR